MKFRRRLAALLLVSVCRQVSRAAELEVGFAASDITPPVGMRLCGFSTDRHGGEPGERERLVEERLQLLKELRDAP